MLALFAMLLVLTASTVQVCHSHGEPGSRAGGFTPATGVASGLRAGPASAPAPADRPATPEDHCPLCVAMHSALPATGHVDLVQLVAMAHVTSTAMEAERLFRWRFALLSRPPPALS